VSAARDEGLRVALVLHRGAPRPSELALEGIIDGLADAGQAPTAVRAAPRLELPLRWRGFTEPLTHIPLAVRALWKGGYDVAHALSAPDAQAALLWGRLSGRPVVFGCPEVLDRDRLADGRLRLRLLIAAVEETDAVVAPTPEAREALWRWLAVDASLIAPRDGAGHTRLYRRLLDQT
jgi:hypothetical protein